MSVAKIIEISASSKTSFDDAIKSGKNIEGAWVQDQKVTVTNGAVTEYRVMLKVTFVLE